MKFYINNQIVKNFNKNFLYQIFINFKKAVKINKSNAKLMSWNKEKLIN